MTASLCILAYKRLDLLKETLLSLQETIDYPSEIILNIDGEDMDILKEVGINGKLYSKLIFSRGNNRGVGRSFQNCLGVAEGDYIFKLDADLTFHPNWLSQAVAILKTETVNAIGLFDYNKWDPHDERFDPKNNVIEDKGTYQIVKDFVSSAYGFRTKDFHLEDWKEVPDDGLHQSFGKLALKHSVDNTAFGVGKSAYVSGTMDKPYKTPTFDKPLLFGH